MTERYDLSMAPYRAHYGTHGYVIKPLPRARLEALLAFLLLAANASLEEWERTTKGLAAGTHLHKKYYVENVCQQTGWQHIFQAWLEGTTNAGDRTRAMLV